MNSRADFLRILCLAHPDKGPQTPDTRQTGILVAAVVQQFVERAYLDTLSALHGLVDNRVSEK
jgi:hypothetical protein